MIKEEKIRSWIEEELLWLKEFAEEENTNLYKNDLLEADRKLVRITTLYEVLDEVPSEDAIAIVKFIKEKIQ
jgi:hypothetical protein